MRAFDHETSPRLPKNDTDMDIVKCLKSGKWIAKIQNPVSKIWVLVGAYANSEEAVDSCFKKKLEYEANPLQDIAVTGYEKSKNELHRGGSLHAAGANNGSVSCVKKGKRKAVNTLRRIQYHHVSKRPSGRWQTEIRHPMTKARVYLGTYATVEEAQEAYNRKRIEFDLLALDQSKQNWPVGEGRSNSNCGSGELFVPIDGSTAINWNASELDLGVVDSYGRLVGEYSRLDDELWIC